MASTADVAAVRALVPFYASTSTYPDIDNGDPAGAISGVLDGWASFVVGIYFYAAAYTEALRLAAACRLAELAKITTDNSGGQVGSVVSATAGPQSLTLGGAALNKARWSEVDAYLSKNDHGLALLALRDSRPGMLPRCV